MLWHHFFFLYQCSKINHHYAQPKLYSFSTICRCWETSSYTLFILNFAEVLTRHLVATYKFG